MEPWFPEPAPAFPRPSEFTPFLIWLVYRAARPAGFSSRACCMKVSLSRVISGVPHERSRAWQTTSDAALPPAPLRVISRAAMKLSRES